jgi:hypothetical protein
MLQRVVPLKFKGKVVGSAVIEADEKGVKVLTTNITDPELREMLEGAPPSFSIKNTKVE